MLQLCIDVMVLLKSFLLVAVAARITAGARKDSWQ